MKISGIIIVSLMLLLIMAVPAFADPSIPAVPETQGFVTSTAINAQGTVTESDAVAWTLSSTNATAIAPPLGPDQIQYTTAYDANVQAIGGQTTFVKSLNVNTGNKVLSQSNVKASTDVQFIPVQDGGIAIGSENLMLDGAGNYTTASDKTICPFATASGNTIPAFCDIVQAGSAYQLNIGSIVTSTDERFVGTDAVVPVVLNYNINIKGITLTDGTTAPALGSANAYIKAHLQNARNNNLTKAEDFTYAETSTISGVISGFSKSMGYQSQVVQPSAATTAITAPV